MKKLYICLAIALFCCSIGNTFSQDIHFSQFYFAPISLNPAMTGVINDDIRLIANYRNQWGNILKNGAYKTYSISYDQKFALGRNDYIGIGGQVWQDKAGTVGYKMSNAVLSLSLAKKINGSRFNSNFLVSGIQVGYGQHSFNPLSGKWGSQFNPSDDGSFSNNESYENIMTEHHSFLDFSAGIMWFSTFHNNQNLYFGGSLSLITEPNLEFYNGTSNILHKKFTIHTGGEFQLSDNINLVPGMILLIQGPSMEIDGGTNIKFRYASKEFLQFGVWTRFSNQIQSQVNLEAIILSSRWENDNYGIGLSYDFQTSMGPSQAKAGSIEFSFFYTFSSNNRSKVYCPDF